MAAIPGGSFKMGRRGDQVTVSAYCLDKTEVTVAEFQSCVSAGGCSEPDPYSASGDATYRACNWKRPGALSHPINCVDWTQADSFCVRANKRLPSEEEWEWAARNGDEGSAFPWGEEAPTAVLLNACGSECLTFAKRELGLDWTPPMYPADDGWPLTAPVGSFPKGANRWGVLDLAGNVAEWTSSKDELNFCACRGGAWADHLAEGVSASLRPGLGPAHRHPILGFRCARSLP